jgi:hypothetical protein
VQARAAETSEWQRRDDESETIRNRLISLRAQIELERDRMGCTNLGIRNTTVVPRLGERLVLAVSVALRWSSSHFDLSEVGGEG